MEPIITPASRLGIVEEYYFSRKLREIAQMRAAGKEVLNLGIGSPDLPPSEAVIEELSKHARRPDVHAYQSYNGIPELRRALAAWYAEYFGVHLDPEGEVLPLIGSKEGILHISMSYLEAGDEVLVPNPGYPAYRAVAHLTGANIRDYLLEAGRGWTADLDALAREDLTKVKLMWLNYPNMPTGAPADPGYFCDLVDFARTYRILLVNDNPYTFILNDLQVSLLSTPGAMEVALELNSLSKAHNMAGWRVGMLAGRKPYLDTVLRFKSNMDSGMFKPLQLAAARAVQEPPEWYDELNAIYRQRREVVLQLLDALGCHADPGQVGMFVWAKIPAGFTDGYALSDEILEKAHVFITPGGIFGSMGDPYIRVSLCSDREIYLEALRRVKAQILPNQNIQTAL